MEIIFIILIVLAVVFFGMGIWRSIIGVRLWKEIANIRKVPIENEAEDEVILEQSRFETLWAMSEEHLRKSTHSHSMFSEKKDKVRERREKNVADKQARATIETIIATICFVVTSLTVASIALWL
jgi:hypothetical protein